MKNKILNIIGICSVCVALIFAIFLTKEKTMQIGIKPENMDMNVNPGDDFYDFATLGWRKSHPLPNDYTRYGTFDMLAEENNKRVREIVENDNGKIGLLYKIAMDEKKLNADKTNPVKPYLDEIDNIKNISDLIKYMGKMQAFSHVFWRDGVGPDEMDSSHYLYNILQGGTGLSRDYYFDDDEKSQNIRKKYKEYITKQMDNFGVNVDAEKLYKLEERMAKSFYKKEKLRNPLDNYHKKSIDELKSEFKGFDWNLYFKSRGINPEYINIGQPEAIKESIAIINDTDLDLIKTYLKYVVINESVTYLDDKTYDIAFDFYNRVLSGQKEPKPRWKRAVVMIDGSLGEVVGQLYVKKYFPAAAKKRMETLVENLQRALGDRIKNSTWMSEETKIQALNKLNTFKAKIGYPDTWRDYSGLKIENDSLFANMMRVSMFEDDFWNKKIGKEKDPTIWYMNAHEANAYYDPSTNEICFPAGILQYPFFDMSADDAFNYGAIGSVIGHEMTHGFDDSGRHFDKDGNMKEWWTAEDSKQFEKRANVMKEHFNKIEILPGLHANGEYTLGENLADYGGVTISFDAYKKYGKKSEDALGMTAEQRFFVAYAMGETSNIREEEMVRRTKTDEHSLSRWRVNGILPHVDAWYKVFDIKEKSKLYIMSEKRAKIW